MTIRKLSVAALLVALVGTAAGCNLAMARAGARCPAPGKYAQDGTYILKCSSKKVWVKGITVALGDAAVRYLLTHATTTTTTAPAPPLSTFGAGAYAVGTSAGQVAPGLYRTDSSGASCGWERLDASDNQLGYNTFTGSDFMQVRSSDAVVHTVGPCTWTTAPTGAVSPNPANATLRNGLEVSTGYYGITGGPNCYWEIDSSMDGSEGSILSGGHSSGPFLIRVTSDVAAMQTRDCGAPTSRPTPTRSLFLSGSAHDGIVPNDNLWYDQTTATIAATLDVSGQTLTVTGAGWTVVMAAPTGQHLIAGSPAYGPVAVTANGTTPGLSFSGNGHSCSTVGGLSQFRIDTLTTDGSGNVTALNARFLQYCNGATTEASAGIIQF